MDNGTKLLEKNAACVRFVDDERSGEGLKLLVSAGHNIDDYKDLHQQSWTALPLALITDDSLLILFSWDIISLGCSNLD